MNLFSQIIYRIKILLSFRDACRTQKICFPDTPHVATLWEDDYEQFFSPENLLALKSNVDEKSCKVLDLFFSRLKVFLALRKEYYYAVVLNEPFESDAKDKMNFEKICQKYKKSGVHLLPESLYFHHGLKDSSEKIKNYIAGKIFIDGGACYGDSTLAFMHYDPLKVLAFDISPRMTRKYVEVMKKQGVPEDKYQIIQKGLGEKREFLTFDDKTIGSSTLFSRSGSTQAEIIPLDACEELKGSVVGLIKFDLEGYGLPAFKGMLETIKRDRPVLALAVYHCGSELFGIKKLFDSLNLNYVVEYKSCFFDHYGELTMFAYPQELLQK